MSAVPGAHTTAFMKFLTDLPGDTLAGARRLPLVKGRKEMTDLYTDTYTVISTDWGGKRQQRTVFALSSDDAQHAHREHYPNDQIVAVRTTPGAKRHCDV
jgi:hypothetical protein